MKGMLCAIHSKPIIGCYGTAYYHIRGIHNPGATFVCSDCPSREAPIRAKTRRGIPQ